MNCNVIISGYLILNPVSGSFDPQVKNCWAKETFCFPVEQRLILDPIFRTSVRVSLVGLVMGGCDQNVITSRNICHG